MKVVLLQDVKGQGKRDQLIEVSEGYARNFLLPRKLAIEADAKVMNEIRNKEAARQYRVAEEQKAARETAARLSSVTLKIRCASGADGKLYGAVTAKDVAEALEKETGISVDKRKLTLSEPIRSYGMYTAEVRLYTDIVGKFTVVVHD